MPQSVIQFKEWDEHKWANSKPWMRDFKIQIHKDFISKEQQVQINRSRSVSFLCAAHSTERPFDFEKCVEKTEGSKSVLISAAALRYFGCGGPTGSVSQSELHWITVQCGTSPRSTSARSIISARSPTFDPMPIKTRSLISYALDSWEFPTALEHRISQSLQV